jgi:protein-L-isoaspartate O-methyltransferase
MAFKDNILEFKDNEIWDEKSCMEVMMSWEAPVMEKAAEYICHNSGDVLEIGFGMGICADYIQAQGVNSHTIIEIHPQILERLNTWASGKSNVTIIEGDWSNISGLSTYDGIFLDTFGDLNLSKFKEFALAKIKSGGKITYWNNEEEEYNPYNFDSVSYEQISVSPDDNYYTRIKNNYYMPKVG